MAIYKRRFYVCLAVCCILVQQAQIVLQGDNIPWQAFRKSSGVAADMGLNLRLRMCSKSMRYVPAVAAGMASCIVLYPSRSSATSGAADALSAANKFSTCSRIRCCKVRLWASAEEMYWVWACILLSKLAQNAREFAWRARTAKWRRLCSQTTLTQHLCA